MKKRKEILWVFYQQIAGNWGWQISDGNFTIWSKDRYPTEFAASDAAEEEWFAEFGDDRVPPPVQFFRTAREYVKAQRNR
jgi:hypothetical protein